jgi:hypothetical protein
MKLKIQLGLLQVYGDDDDYHYSNNKMNESHIYY